MGRALVWVFALLWIVLAVRTAWAVDLTSVRPWWVERVALGSTTDWEVYVAPTWARQVIVRNAHASATLYLGNYDETGTFSSGSDDYLTLPAGAAVTLPLSSGSSQVPDAAHRNLPLASAQASHPVEIVIFETPE